MTPRSTQYLTVFPMIAESTLLTPSMLPIAATATAMLCGEMILPMAPPAMLAATSCTGSTPSSAATSVCICANKTPAEVVEPVTNVPMMPTIGAKAG